MIFIDDIYDDVGDNHNNDDHNDNDGYDEDDDGVVIIPKRLVLYML